MSSPLRYASRAFVAFLGLILATTDFAQRKPPPAPAKAKKPAKPDRSEKLFGEFLVPRFHIEIAEPEMQKLRQDPRNYVRTKMKVTLPDGEQTFVDVGVHLKRAAGSFRGIDDRPALTVNFDKFKKGQKFFDLDKIHLNNSAQDGGYMNELVCSELNLAAKVPTARATHAKVQINNRDMGLYVLKESYDKTFLKRHFGDDEGNLYDGGFLQEIDANLQKDSGKGPDDKSDLKQLVEACRENDPVKRVEKLEKILDIDEFCRFMALELMCGHWDGYIRNRNNYRIYFNPANGGRAAFIPHGMDQMFGDPNESLMQSNALVSQAIMNTPELRWRYRDIAEKLTVIFDPVKTAERMDFHRKHLVPAVKEFNPGQAQQLDGHINGMKDRLKQRSEGLQRQLAIPEPRPIKFDDKGVAKLDKWGPLKADDAIVDTVAEGRGLHVQVGPSKRSTASWRKKVILTQGKYRLEAKAKTTDVQAIEDQSGSGAGVRLSGGQRTNKLTGSTDWTVIGHDFEVNEGQREVELVLELRASNGQVWFDTQHLMLMKK